MAVRILVADDHALVRRALRATLEEAGYSEVVEAENGADAVILASHLKPELVILDLAMPTMDGFRATRAIKALLPNVPIVIHTLHWSRRVELEALKAGAQKVVPKSDSGNILSAVQELLPLENSPVTRPEPKTDPTARPGSALSEARTAELKRNGAPRSSGARVPEE